MIVYNGPSAIDGAPIIGIITGLDRPSANRKTGPMAQLWILPRDTPPVEAVKNGDDYSVCADCPLRGELGRGRACYVNVGHAPAKVWRTFHRGSYAGSAYKRRCWHALGGTMLRLGAWGEPTALPAGVVQDLIDAARGWTGYTHRWRDVDACPWARWLMASVESVNDAREAQAAGWRTFRIGRTDVTDVAWPGLNEILCPAYSRDHVSCADCGLCDGNRTPMLAPYCGRDDRANIVTPAHGSGAKYVGAGVAT